MYIYNGIRIKKSLLSNRIKEYSFIIRKQLSIQIRLLWILNSVGYQGCVPQLAQFSFVGGHEYDHQTDSR